MRAPFRDFIRLSVALLNNEFLFNIEEDQLDFLSLSLNFHEQNQQRMY